MPSAKEMRPVYNLRIIYGNNPDLLDRLKRAEIIYRNLDQGLINPAEADELLEKTVFDREDLNTILDSDDSQIGGLVPLAAVRSNMRRGRSLLEASEYNNPK